MLSILQLGPISNIFYSKQSYIQQNLFQDNFTDVQPNSREI